MKKHKPLKAPKGHKDIAKQLRWIAEHMMDIGTSMDYYGGFDEKTVHRGRDLVELGMLVESWADYIKCKQKSSL